MTSSEHKNETSMSDLKEMSLWLLTVSSIFNQTQNKFRNFLLAQNENLNLPVKIDNLQVSKFKREQIVYIYIKEFCMSISFSLCNGEPSFDEEFWTIWKLSF